MIFTYQQWHDDCVRITVKNGEHEARVDVYAAIAGPCPRPARITYPIMGDDSPEFAETMAAALLDGAKRARQWPVAEPAPPAKAHKGE